MAVVTSADLLAIYKTLYPGNLPKDMMLRKHPLAQRLRQKGGFTGYDMKIPVRTGYPPGRTASASILLGSTTPAGPSTNSYFSLTRAKDYAKIDLDAELLKATADDKGAFISARRLEMDGLYKQIGNSYAHALFRSGTGSLGNLSTATNTATKTINLYRKSDAKFFYKGQQLQFATAASGDVDGISFRDTGDYVTVVSVDRDAGTVLTDAATDLATSITGIANNSGAGAAFGDFIYTRGDAGTGTTVAGGKIKGLSAWFPLTAPSSTAFFGLDRTAAIRELSGHRLNDTGMPIDEAAITLTERIVEYGGSPDAIVISHKNFRRLSLRQNAKVVEMGGGGSATSGFSKISIATSQGPIEVMPDSDCPDELGYVLTMDTLCFHHLGDMPELVQDDGNTALRLSTSDAIEIRVRYYGNLGCTEPAHNGVFAIGTTV